MTSTPLVSIVTPTLNQAQFLGATLRSVMRQGYPRVEHIVVDGGSTDGSLEVLRSYEGRYDLRWSSGPDAGMYDAINRGLEQARGDVIAYLNSDDLFFPWTVETVVGAIHNGTADLVYGDVIKVDMTSGAVQLVFSPPFDAPFLRRVGSLFQPTVFWRRSVIERVGVFDPQLQFGGDLDFWIRIAAVGRLERIDEVLAIERIHEAAKSSAWASTAAEEERAIRSRHEQSGALVVAASRVSQRARTWIGRRRLWGAFRHESTRASPVRWPGFIGALRPAVPVVPWVLAQLPLVGIRFVGRALGELDRASLGLDDEGGP